MFSCLWHLWDWLDPTSMENKKSTGNTPTSEIITEAIPKHTHQHSTTPQHLRLLQYGLKIPNHQTSPHQHHPPISPHFHQHRSQSPLSYHQGNVYQNQIVHTQQYHQHQQKRHSPHFHYQSINQPVLHSHHLNQQNAQSWVPHQPPEHYHSQQQQQQHQQQQLQQQQHKAEPQTPLSTKQKEPERKKSSNQQLRSPAAKRPAEAPVTIQGWLHKQGSDGLMLWKKRWFVLSEYCLFYYKGPEEEKLLGSILLPSYKVSVCGQESKINKKYAFKCEHANMRTYILAADSQEIMMQWIHLLNKACLLQNTNEPEQFSQSSSIPSPSVESPVVRQNIRNTPIHMHSSSNTTDLSNPSHQELSQYTQPLYANAPPKPRRLTDGYSSPSSELDRYSGEPKYVTLQPLNQYNGQPIYITRNVKSPVHLYGNPEYIQQQMYNKHLHLTEYGVTTVRENNAERRTPDTYGRSKLNLHKETHLRDYEDVYTDQAIYKRPLSPLNYTNKMISIESNPTTVVMRTKTNLPYVPLNQLQRVPNTIPRPHSADFLEYEIKHQNRNILPRQPRPKSSLDINRYASNDNYFYTEERYAEKMRKSTQYLPKMSKHPTVQNDYQQKYPMGYSKTESDTFPLIRPNNIQSISFDDTKLREFQQNLQPVRSRSVLSDGSLSKELDLSPNECISPSFRNQDYYESNQDYEQMTRSASARLTQNCKIDGKPINREGERRREESMKRLLEWKQRMLQSPLNRKVNNQTVRGSMGKFVYYRNNENGYANLTNLDGYVESQTIKPLPQYNSYSSDDEENEDGTKENVQTQAGRTTDTYPSISEPHIPALIASTAVFNSLPKPDESLASSDTMHDVAQSTVNKLPVVCTGTIENNSQDPQTDYKEDIFEKPLKISTKQCTHTALVSSLRSEFSNKFETNPIVTEVKSNGAYVKSILAEIEKKNREDTVSTPTNMQPIVEENYMTMTPKKHILAPNSQDIETDENPYVEMTQNADGLQPNELQTYEPVYAELNQLSLKTSLQDVLNSKTGLPDILLESKNKKQSSNKSDSSDADDEASKDLDSLDTPCHPRFSLSDTFRPASYYLGASRTAPEHQDSSDSELVSPPPIPTSPPPLEDLDSTDECLSSIQDVSLNESYLKKAATSKKLTLDQDNSSLYSLNDDQKLNLTDSDVELQLPGQASYERMLKRRPVSEESFDELKSLTNYLDKSLKFGHETTDHNYENMYVSSDKQLQLESSSIFDDSTIYVHSRDNSRDTSSSTIKSDLSNKKFVPNDFIIRARPQSSTSITGEVSGFLSPIIPDQHTPTRPASSIAIQEIDSSSYFFQRKSKQFNLSSLNKQSAPYYYSDLSINTSKSNSSSSILTLNNQRLSMNGSKRDITHIVNPIRCNNQATGPLRQNLLTTTCTLAAEARSASVDFLNIADKSGNIDKKNIYESDTLKRLKVSDSTLSLQSKSQVRNLYAGNKSDKFTRSDDTNVRRSYSLEGLLENVLNDNLPVSQEFHLAANTSFPESIPVDGPAEDSQVWEEDSIWRERLRSASERHTRSLDDLDNIKKPEDRIKQRKHARGISRVVTYVNDNMFNMPIHDKKQMKLDAQKDDTESKEAANFIIDREKLRQWDFLSSAPSDVQLYTQSPAQGCINSVVDLGAGMSACESSEQNDAPHSASGSISITTKDTFPRQVSAKKVWIANSRPMQLKLNTNLNRNYETDYQTPQGYYSSQRSNPDLNQHNTRRANWQLGEKMNISAGELLGRTHEELVLLLIQLRRQSANNCTAIETCYNEIDNIQAKLPKMDPTKRLENLQRLEQLKQHLLELEKQYEKGKPLVNLVDNMVKLGSLYRFPKDHNNYPYVKDKLEFNQHIQERRLLAEERRDWNRLSPNHTELQTKVQQLYQLDKLIQEESEKLQGLQQDKEEIERALGGLRYKLIKGFKDPAEVEQARKQQILLENELTRVHSMLAQNSRKLEETVAGNARLEQELLVLKQKLQISRQQRSSPQISNAGDSLPCVVGTSAMLESDLHRVQQNVGDLQRQRQELSMQVRQLTDRSNNLQQLKISSNVPNLTNQTKKKMNSFWRETDLDTMNSIDHGESWEHSSNSSISVTPLYISTNKKLQESDFSNSSYKSNESNEDISQNQLPQEKQEIKTVRIVKRESERRQRDREKVTTGKWDAVMEEEDPTNSSILFRPTPVQKTQSNNSLELLSPDNSENEKSSGILSRQSSLSNPSLPQSYTDIRNTSSVSVEGNLDKSLELSPVFKSEAARQIIIEMSNQDVPKQTNRRIVPKEKRRHYTAPHNNLIMKSLNQLPTNDKDFNKVDLNIRRARDDLDMEQALRQRIDAPDVVRSTLSNKEHKYNESTIDNILGTPNKIFIPERYVPEQLPQLSAEEQQHRLRKVESIKKMLSDTTIISGSSANLNQDETNSETPSSSVVSKATSKMIEEKKQREHLLQLNQILAKQVMEMSKIVAVKALASLPLESEILSSGEEDYSPDTPLPIYQQRDNFYS